MDGMPLRFPEIVRLTVVGTLSGEDCMNVFDVKMSGPSSDEERRQSCFGLAGDLLNQWDDHILPIVSNRYTATEVRWVDLNSNSGSTGSRSSTGESTWPKNGDVNGNPLPNNTYALISKQLQQKARTTRNGTCRLGGIMEEQTEQTNGNLLTPANVTAISAAFENLKDGLNGSGSLPGWEQNMGVLHTVEGEAVGFSFISTFSCRRALGTLRRRMPGYGS